MTKRPNATVAIVDLVPCSSRKGDSLTGDAISSEAPFRRFHGLSLLEWSIRRLNESTRLDTIVITGTPQQRDLVLSASICGASWLPSVHASPLKRAEEIANRTNAEWLVFISPTCPFTDPVLLDRLITTAWQNPNVDFLSYFAPNAPRLSLSKLGLVGEICNTRIVRELVSNKCTETGRVPELLRRASAIQMRMLPLPAALQREDLRFNLESLEDWDLAHAYLEVVGEDVSWQNLAALSLPTS